MRTKLTPLFALAAVAALTLGLLLLPSGSSAAPVALTSFNGTHSGPRASSTVMPNDRPTIFKIDQARNQGADIALLASVNPAHYPDLVALSAANNNAFENMAFGIRITAGMHVGTLNAENNWWGSATGPTIASNPAGTGVVIEDPDGVVDYTPFLTSSPF